MRPQRGACAIAGRWTWTFVIFLFAGMAASHAKDLALYKITKGIQYQQTNAGPPVVFSENGYVFQADVYLRPGGAVRSATVKSAEGTVRTLAQEDANNFEFRNKVNTITTLETKYPDGNFAFAIDAVNDGMKNLKLPLTGNRYPNSPRILNLSDMSSANAHGSLLVVWAPFSGGTAADFIQLRIEDSGGSKMFQTPDFGEQGALAGTATYAVVEPDKLKPGATYEATVRFEKTSALDQTSYTGVPGWSTYHALTHFAITTSSAPTPSLDSYEIAKGRSFTQTNSGPAVPDTGDEFMFDAKAKGHSSNALAQASISIPGRSMLPMLTDTNREDFENSDSQTNRAVFESLYPDGTYTFNIETSAQGNWSLPLALTSSSYPPVPHVYFDSSQKVPANRELVISWDAWLDGTGNDYIQLRVLDGNDKIFETPDFGEKGALNGYATYAIVPSDKLKQAKTYKARLYFRRIIQVDTAHYPGSLGFSDYFSRLKFKIETAPPDVQGFALSKGIEFYQADAETSSPTGYVFSALVAADSPGAITTAAIRTPSGSSIPLTLDSGGQTLSLRDVRSAQSVFEAAYPDGTYVFDINGLNDGPRSFSISLTGAAYPNPPQLSNFAEAGRLDPFDDISIRWDPFLNGEGSDLIRCELRTTAGGIVSGINASGFETEFLIPAESLPAGQAFPGTLMFEKITAIDQTNYPPATGRASYYARTQFTVMTIGPGNPATLRDLHVLPDRRIQFSMDAVVGGNYRIEGSPDLVHWTQIGTLSATSNDETFIASPPPNAPANFFRVMLTR